MTLDGISLEVLGPLGGVLFLVFFPYLQMARGKLVPRSTLNDYREAHRISEEARALLAEQVSELLEHARTSDALLRSITERNDK
jgi:hypothetical protein